MDIAGLRALRRRKDAFFKENPQSPLTDAQKLAFDGLRYYPPNPDLIFEVEIEPFAEQKQIVMHTNRDELKPFTRYGLLSFPVDDQTATLTLYQSPEGMFFLPFVDAGAGEATYPAGRYLDLDPIDDDVFLVDFNLAYNPFCAYNDNWVCPVPPPENRLTVPIEAGEMIPAGVWVG